MTITHILIIDIDADTLKECGGFLSSRKATTITTYDIRAALREFSVYASGTLLNDLAMPTRDGIEALRDTKRAAPQTKIIAISKGSSALPTESLNLARTLGADGSVSKPVDATQLLKAIEAVLSCCET